MLGASGRKKLLCFHGRCEECDRIKANPCSERIEQHSCKCTKARETPELCQKQRQVILFLNLIDDEECLGRLSEVARVNVAEQVQVDAVAPGEQERGEILVPAKDRVARMARMRKGTRGNEHGSVSEAARHTPRRAGESKTQREHAGERPRCCRVGAAQRLPSSLRARR